jgi:hypothetical protein
MKTLEWYDTDRLSIGTSENQFSSFIIFEMMERSKICYNCYFSLNTANSNGRIYIGSRKTLKNAKKFCENTFKLI